MGRCQHQNAQIAEEFIAHSFFEFENGTLVYNDNTPEGGNYSGKLIVRCQDCGYKGKFNRLHKNNPAWLIRLLDQLVPE